MEDFRVLSAANEALPEELNEEHLEYLPVAEEVVIEMNLESQPPSDTIQMNMGRKKGSEYCEVLHQLQDPIAADDMDTESREKEVEEEAVIYEGQKFKTWNEFACHYEKFLKNTYECIFVVKSSQSAKKYNRWNPASTIPLSCGYKSVIFECAHGKKAKSTSTGLRPHQNILKMNCTARVTVNYNNDENVFEITQCDLQHVDKNGTKLHETNKYLFGMYNINQGFKAMNYMIPRVIQQKNTAGNCDWIMTKKNEKTQEVINRAESLLQSDTSFKQCKDYLRNTANLTIPNKTLYNKKRELERSKKTNLLGCENSNTAKLYSNTQTNENCQIIDKKMINKGVRTQSSSNHNSVVKQQTCVTEHDSVFLQTNLNEKFHSDTHDENEVYSRLLIKTDTDAYLLRLLDAKLQSQSSNEPKTTSKQKIPRHQETHSKYNIRTRSNIQSGRLEPEKNLEGLEKVSFDLEYNECELPDFQTKPTHKLNNNKTRDSEQNAVPRLKIIPTQLESNSQDLKFISVIYDNGCRKTDLPQNNCSQISERNVRQKQKSSGEMWSSPLDSNTDSELPATVMELDINEQTDDICQTVDNNDTKSIEVDMSEKICVEQEEYVNGETDIDEEYFVNWLKKVNRKLNLEERSPNRLSDKNNSDYTVQVHRKRKLLDAPLQNLQLRLPDVVIKKSVPHSQSNPHKPKKIQQDPQNKNLEHKNGCNTSDLPIQFKPILKNQLHTRSYSEQNLKINSKLKSEELVIKNNKSEKQKHIENYIRQSLKSNPTSYHVLIKHYNNFRGKLRNTYLRCNICKLESDRQCTTEQKAYLKKQLLAIEGWNETLVESRKCSVCRNYFNSEGHRIFLCSYCPKSFSGDKRQMRHIRREHTFERFGCPHCNRSYAEPKSLKHHIQEKHDDSYVHPHACDKCGKTYRYEKQLQKHMMCHLGNQKHILCNLCGYTCSTPGNLKVHISHVHSDEKPFECNDCGRRWKTKCVLVKHIKRVHGDRTAKTVACKFCDKKFFDGHNLKLHMIRHFEPRFQCALCPKRFHEKSKCKRHLQNTHKHMPYQSPIITRASDEMA